MFVQRFNSDLALNLHLHGIFLEGCYDRASPEAPVFTRTRAPTDDDVAWVARRIAAQVRRLLERRGLTDRAGFEDAIRTAAEDEPALLTLAAAAAQGTHALDGSGARPLERLRGDAPAPHTPRSQRRGRLCVAVDGFNLHAATFVPQGRRRRLEQLLTHVARPALSDERLTLLPDGNVALKLKKRWKDGTVAVILPPAELICRLAALVSRPLHNGVVYFGVLAGNAKLRPNVVPGPRARHRHGAHPDTHRSRPIPCTTPRSPSATGTSAPAPARGARPAENLAA